VAWNAKLLLERKVLNHQARPGAQGGIAPDTGRDERSEDCHHQRDRGVQRHLTRVRVQAS
jgi:hypothetical protein